MIDVDQKPNEKRLTELAQRIRTAREEAHLSQDTLGKGIGVSDKSISAYEQGRSVPPIAKLKKIAECTRRPLAFFTQEDPNEAIITTTLLSIERELKEVKRLLIKAKK